jgi:hypothetical protein
MNTDWHRFCRLAKTGRAVASRRKSGMALVLVLFLIGLLTVTVVALLSTIRFGGKAETASRQGRRAELMARSAFDVILHDLQAEMTAGSTVFVDNGERLLVPVVLPTGANAPARVVDAGIDPLAEAFRTLVKQSGKGRFFPATTPWTATAVTPLQAAESDPLLDTSLPSRDGRYIDPQRWQAPLFNTESLAAGQTPRWVLLTREGTSGWRFVRTGRRDVRQFRW